MEPGVAFCAQFERLRCSLTLEAFDWLEMIVVHDGTGLVTHRDNKLQDLVRPGQVVVLMPNVPCGISPEGQLVVTRVCFRPLFVIEQVHWSDPGSVPDVWTAASRFRSAIPSQVVSIAGPEWAEMEQLVVNLAKHTSKSTLCANYWNTASWALRLLGIVNDKLGSNGANGLFKSDDAVVDRPTEPCFGKVQGLRDDVRLVMKMIEERFADKLRLKDLAEAVHLSRPQLERVFSEQVGKTPKAYQNLYRVKCMVSLLLHTDLPVAAISVEAGWKDPSRASRVFKESTTMLPSEYRQAFASIVGERPGYVNHLMSHAILLTFAP